MENAIAYKFLYYSFLGNRYVILYFDGSSYQTMMMDNVKGLNRFMYACGAVWFETIEEVMNKKTELEIEHVMNITTV